LENLKKRTRAGEGEAKRREAKRSEEKGRGFSFDPCWKKKEAQKLLGCVM